MSNRRHRPSAEEAIESTITLSERGSAKLAEMERTSTVDSSGRTYAQRMHDKAEKARQAR